MKLIRILAVARKETYHIIRDWRSLFMAIATPLFLIVLFGFALTLDVDNVPMIVWDQSHTPKSREFISKFDGSRYFSLVGGEVDNYRDLEWAIDKGNAVVAMVIPYDFSAQVERGNTAEVQLIFDGSDSNTATLAMGYADAVGLAYGKELSITFFERVTGKSEMVNPIELNTRIWFNSDLDSTNNIVPALIAVIMMVIASLLTSLTIAREWEKGTMEQLIATPIKVPELIIGKMVPYFGIGAIDVILVVLTGHFIFDVPMKGSFLLMGVLSTLFLIGALSLGILISTVAKSQLVASQMAIVLTFLPSFLLSGFISAISNMPIAIQYISYLVPARYFVTVLKSVYLKGVGLEVLWPEALLLVAFGLIMFLLANRKFQKKLVS